MLNGPITHATRLLKIYTGSSWVRDTLLLIPNGVHYTGVPMSLTPYALSTDLYWHWETWERGYWPWPFKLITLQWKWKLAIVYSVYNHNPVSTPLIGVDHEPSTLYIALTYYRQWVLVWKPPWHILRSVLCLPLFIIRCCHTHLPKYL